MILVVKFLIKKIWQSIPFRPVTLLVFVLFHVEEQYPFSHFPMYSRLQTEASVLYVTDEDRNPLAMRRVLNTGTATAKKIYKRELAEITNPLGRDSADSTLEERQLASQRTMEQLLARLDESALPEGTRELRSYLKQFSLEKDGTLDRSEPELLSVHRL